MSVKIQGLERVTENLRHLAMNMQKKHARKASRKALKSVADSAKQNAKRLDDPETANKIYQNIAIRARKSSNRQQVKTSVGVLGGAKSPAKKVGELKGKGKKNRGGDTFYWRFLEFGTSRIAATPFMRPAMSQNIGRIAQDFADELDEAIKSDVR